MTVEWLLDRICDDPVVVIDTARTRAGDWATVVIARDEALSQIEPVQSPSWPAAQEAHARVMQVARDALDARGILRRTTPTSEGGQLPAPDGSTTGPAIEGARALGIDIPMIQGQTRRTPAERIRHLEELRKDAERLRQQPEEDA